MAKALQRRRGTTAEHANFTGLEGEFTYDTTEKRIVAHDGVTAGGIPMAKKSELDSAKSELESSLGETKTELEGAIGKLAKHSVGDEWISYTGIIPEGGVPYCGQEVNRETYSALWAYAQAKGLVKSESEWQSLYNAQGGNVAFYSSGNGSSTFRMPRLVGYVRGASSQSESGSYVKEGLPNIVGTFDTGDRRTHITGTSGALYNNTAESGQWGATSTATGNTQGVGFDASRSNPIYGNSDHVTPETSVALFGVFAFGEIRNVDNLDVGTLTSAFAALESNVDSKFNGVVRSVNGTTADASGNVTVSASPTIKFTAAVKYSSGTITGKTWTKTYTTTQAGYVYMGMSANRGSTGTVNLSISVSGTTIASHTEDYITSGSCSTYAFLPAGTVITFKKGNGKNGDETGSFSVNVTPLVFA